MQAIDTLIHARWILTVDENNTELENHSIAINEGRIVSLLPTSEAKSQYQARHEQDLDNHVLIPGLINTHTHASMSLLRGIADDLPLMDWLQNHIWPAEAKWVSEEFVTDGTRLAIAESIKGGVTCFNEMYFCPDAAAKVAEQAGFRCTIGLIVIDFPTVWAANADEYLSKALDVHDQFRDSPLVSTAFAPHAPYTVSDEPLSRIATLAEELDIPIHMHVHETAHEVSESEQNHGKRPLARLEELGLLTPRLLAVHMTQLTEEEIAQCTANGIHILHCPESNMKLGSGISPVPSLLAAGVNVTLGTDGAASNNDLDMIGEMRTAALLAKVGSMDASALSATTALRMATINGAKALGIDSETGSLEVGKAADISAVDLGQLATLPVYHPCAQLVYSATRDNVSNVWIAGQQVLKDRRLTTMDEDKIHYMTQEWGEKMREDK